jgi:ribosomal protein S6--L-glutamate ligase
MGKILRFKDFLLESKRQGKKKVLFVSFPDKKEEISYHDYLKSKINSDFCTWEELIFDKGDILFDGKSLSDYGFIVAGVVGSHPKYFVSLEEYMDLNKIPYLNYGCSPERNNKILQNRILHSKNLSPIPTIIGVCSEIDPEQAVKELGLPIVAKITDGSQGKGITLQKNISSLKSYLKKNKDKEIIFQKFIESNGAYRLFFIGDKLLWSIEQRSSEGKKEFRNNNSLGGTAKEVKLPIEAINLAKKCSKAMGFDVSGVDLIKKEGTNEWYVLEINSAPQFDFYDHEDKKFAVSSQNVLDEFIKIIKNKMS